MGFSKAYTYVSQDTSKYDVVSGDRRELKIPKGRSTENESQSTSKNLKVIYKLLILQFISLLISGITALLIFPFILIKSGNLAPEENKKVGNFIYPAAILFILEIALSVIFVIHLIY